MFNFAYSRLKVSLAIVALGGSVTERHQGFKPWLGSQMLRRYYGITVTIRPSKSPYLFSDTIE